MIRKLILAKLVGFLLVGHVAAQVTVQEAAQAIAHAEGYGVKNAIPTVCHNPGDLKGRSFPGQAGVCKGGHARFRNDAAGWAALYSQIDKILSGESHVYKPTMTLRQISRLYAGNSRVWLKNVTNALHVSADEQFGRILTDRDRLRMTILVKDSAPVDEPIFDFTSFEGVLQQ